MANNFMDRMTPEERRRFTEARLAPKREEAQDEERPVDEAQLDAESIPPLPSSRPIDPVTLPDIEGELPADDVLVGPPALGSPDEDVELMGLPSLAAEIDAEQQATEEEKKKFEEAVAARQAKQFCPHCGQDTSKSPEETPTEDDKVAFVEAILGGTRFERQYAMMGGKVTVRYQALTPDYVMAINQWMDYLQRTGLLRRAGLDIDVAAWLHRGYVAGTVVGVEGTTGKGVAWATVEAPLVFGDEDLKKFHEAITDRCKEIGVRYVHAVQGMVKFNNLVQNLSMHAFDENFWVGASPESDTR